MANNTFTNDAGGRLSGAGTLTANVINNGTVSPGDSPGVLAISGNYSQGPAGTLNLEIGGTTAGSQYDQLNVSASATFAGTLNVNLINGFGPAALQTFTVLNFAGMNGAFDTIYGVNYGRFPLFSTTFSPTHLILTSLVNTADLAFDSFDAFTFPASANAGQTVSVKYTVRNEQATRPWATGTILCT